MAISAVDAGTEWGSGRPTAQAVNRTRSQLLCALVVAGIACVAIATLATDAFAQNSFGPSEGLPESSDGTTQVRWWLISLLFALGAGLYVAAFVADARGWKGLGPSALMGLGTSIGLVGVLFIIQRSLVTEIKALRGPVAVNAYVRHSGEGASEWRQLVVVRPGQRVEILIRFKNLGPETLKDVAVGNNLPRYTSYVNGSTRLRNGAHPSGLTLDSDNITRGGINVGNYGAGSVGYVLFRARLDPVTAYEKVGTYDLRNVGIVRPEGLNEVYNVAQILVEVPRS